MYHYYSDNSGKEKKSGNELQISSTHIDQLS